MIINTTSLGGIGKEKVDSPKTDRPRKKPRWWSDHRGDQRGRSHGGYWEVIDARHRRQDQSKRPVTAANRHHSSERYSPDRCCLSFPRRRPKPTCEQTADGGHRGGLMGVPFHVGQDDDGHRQYVPRRRRGWKRYGVLHRNAGSRDAASRSRRFGHLDVVNPTSRAASLMRS